MDAFEETWVDPFYLLILHGNYSALRGKEKAAFVQQVRYVLAAITEDTVARLLASHDWRNQLTGSWFCGLKGWKQFAPTIGASLIASNSCYQGQGFAFALACFGDEASARYMTAYLDQYLPQTDCFYDQNWVLPALAWIDAHHGGSRARFYLEPGGLWDKFIADKNKACENKAWEFKINRNRFWRLMKYCKHNLA